MVQNPGSKYRQPDVLSGDGMVKHTFFFEEGVWVAKGVYFDRHNTSIPLAGEVLITHKENLWINNAFMKLKGVKLLEIRNQYEIVPLKKNRDFSTWKSNSSSMRKLKGEITVVDDSIISVYKCEGSEYYGIEYLIKIHDDLYANRGYAFKGNMKLSSWSIELNRKRDKQK